MEVTALCIRLMMNVMVVHVHLSYSHRAVFPQVVPNRLQFFEYESIVISCEGLEGLSGWRVMRKLMGVSTICASSWETYTGACTIKNAFAAESGEYWCEAAGRRTGDAVNITVTAGSVILESPVLPVMEGDDVTLSCRKKATSSNLTADSYKDGLFLGSSSTGEMIIPSVSRSDEGLYRCNISGSGESPQSRLTVRGRHSDSAVQKENLLQPHS
ncbi:Fc receptor-like protein 4 [Lates calcarifer]|uniref:Fc receptor-like protein 4 n=1 Tax=Lates calcarifer TaxID=8187 RepID=A0AAJ8AZ57_LATCA|nr:Fc receptor-like protein 4 [Lates calcarifer]